jgi:hypothetical protein
VISTSKIRKITAIRKNCIEKGAREKNWGLKPHSNGDSFSRSIKDLEEIEEFKIIRNRESKETRIKIRNIIFFKRSLKLEALCT